MRPAFFVVVASIFGESALAATPADRITATHFPAYAIQREAGAFRVVLNIVVKSASSEGETGVADFSINVRFPDGHVVSQECADEEYLFENGALDFAPYPEESCTGEFVAAMNAKFGREVVKSPISLRYNAAENSLLFNAVGGVDVVIPAVAPVPKGRLL
jgi:hypothetical protein